jgi:hypothetical protein
VRAFLCIFLLGLLATPSGAAEDDAAALALTAAPAAAAARFASATIEGAFTEAAQPGAGELNEQRLSLDGRIDAGFADHWRAVLAERLDSDWQSAHPANQEIATMKEAYLGWQPGDDFLVDLGRVNARQGVAYGYNPTDFLRADAVRSIVSPDPNSLRDNRLGTAMLRTEALWGTGALTAVYAPKFSDHTSPATFSPDWGATNSDARWLVSLSQKIVSSWQPQLLAFGQRGQSPQFGLNSTASVGQSTVAYLEISAGRQRSLLAQSLDQDTPDRWRGRGAAGLTYSFANKLSVTLEYEYNGAGADAATWADLRSGNPVIYGIYRQYSLSKLDLATRSNAFVVAGWTDFLVRHLDLNAFTRIDLIDHSLLPYVELRRRWDAIDVALRWQTAKGRETSDYGASPTRQTWQLVFDYYL